MSHHRAIVVVAAIASLLTLPLLLSPYFIAQDLAAHVETAAQIVALLRGDDVIGATYQLHPLPWPNSLPTFAIAGLLPLLGGLAAGKLVTAVFLVAWPSSLAVLFSRLGRSPWLALLAIPTCFDLSFSFGFTHFVVGKAVWAAALVAAVDVARGSSVRRVVVAVIAFVVLFHSHLLLFASAVPLGVIAVVVLAPSWRARGIGVTAVVVGAVPGAWWIFRQPVVSGTSTYLKVSTRLGNLWQDLGELHDGNIDMVPWLIALGAFVVVAMVAPRARFVSRESVVVVVLVGACAGFTLFGPIRTPEASVIAERFASMTAALLPALLPIVVVGPRVRALLVAVGVACAAVMAGDLTYRWRAFSHEQMGDFDDVILAAIPRGAAVATHLVRPLSTWGRHNALWHWPKLVALRGSHTDDAFAWRATCVLGLRPGVTPPKHPALTAAALSPWDYMLIQGNSSSVERAVGTVPLTLVASTGVWRLFRVPAQGQ